MKILFVCRALSGGGGEWVCAALANALTDSHTVGIYLYDDHSASGNANVSAEIFTSRVRQRPGGCRAPRLLSLASEFARVAERFQPDAVIGIMSYANLVAVAAQMYSRRLRVVPIVGSEHSTIEALMPSFGAGDHVRAAVLKVAYRRLTSLVCVSDAVRSDMVAYGFVPRSGAITTVGNPVRAPSKVPRRRREDDRDRRILFVGRLHAQKGVDVLIAAMVLLEDHVSLDIVGDGPEARALRQLSSALQLGHRVRWHGHVPDPSQFWADCDVVALPSRCEGFGLAAYEPLQLGRPVVVSDAGALSELGESLGLSRCPVDDPVALAQAVRETLDSGRIMRVSELPYGSAQDIAERYLDAAGVSP